MTFTHVQDSIVACRNLHSISATAESEVYAFLFTFHVLLQGIS